MLEFWKDYYLSGLYRDLRIGLTDNLKFNVFEGINLKSYTYQFTLDHENPTVRSDSWNIILSRVSSLLVCLVRAKDFIHSNEFSIFWCW